MVLLEYYCKRRYDVTQRTHSGPCGLATAGTLWRGHDSGEGIIVYLKHAGLRRQLIPVPIANVSKQLKGDIQLNMYTLDREQLKLVGVLSSPS